MVKELAGVREMRGDASRLACRAMLGDRQGLLALPIVFLIENLFSQA